jgi:hypothetical protein
MCKYALRFNKNGMQIVGLLGKCLTSVKLRNLAGRGHYYFADVKSCHLF